MGDKASLEHDIHAVTSIPVSALRGVPMSGCSLEEKFRWAADRNTKRPEDRAYCLIGMFDVSMSMRYGEGTCAARFTGGCR
jgi:hypothetical protein